MLPIIEDGTFNPEGTALMGQAFDLASGELHDTGQSAIVQEIIAKRIVELAERDERDPQKLAKLALQSLGVSLPK